MRPLVVGPGAGGAMPPRDPRAQLRRMADEMEGLFLSQLFQAMRASVPRGGLTETSTGQEMFTTMLDETLAHLAAQRMKRGMGEALYRQLSRHLPPEGEPPRP